MCTPPQCTAPAPAPALLPPHRRGPVDTSAPNPTRDLRQELGGDPGAWSQHQRAVCPRTRAGTSGQRAAGLTMTDVGTDSTAGANAAAAVAVFAALGREAEQPLDKHLALGRHSPAAARQGTARPPPPAPWRDQRPTAAASAPVLVLSAHRGCARRGPRATGSSSDEAAASAMGDCWWWGQSRGSALTQPAGS